MIIRVARNRACWQVNQHASAPRHVRQVVANVMLVRSVDHEPQCILQLIPNELMFEIFTFLPWL
jgi:hypothetical protein